MSGKKPYIDYEFAGVMPFTSSLDRVGIKYEIVNDENVTRLFESCPDLLRKDDDTAVLGKCVKEGNDFFFMEFGIKITASYKSYIVFVYDHRPGFDELRVTINDLEGVIMKKLDSVNPDSIKSDMSH